MPRTLLCLLLVPLTARADEAAVRNALSRPILGPRQSLLDLQDHLEPRIVRMPTVRSAEEWTRTAGRLRQDILERVVLRGVAPQWQKARLGVEYAETIPGGEGYSIRKLRYEAVPGLWIPGLLYVPDRRPARTPVMLAVNGHDRNGKAAPYKQIRCINLAKRGMLVLNVEWFGMGQLRAPGHAHGAMNQLDLCGTSGLAPFYLAMTRGLDVLLAHPGADPNRVAVSGLSGGGWQTIVVSALDERVTLANPVAGYSGFRVRLRDHFKDMGDSEQTPVDLATVADYTHLTALRAPRPTLLTYNAKDECCFEAGYALPPLLDAARPVYRLFGKEEALRSHVNHDPGTHNFEKDNRQQLYRMVGDFFYPGEKGFDSKEIPCEKEVKSASELNVELPGKNASFNTLARALAADLPRQRMLPGSVAAAREWQVQGRKTLTRVLKLPIYPVVATETGRHESGGTTAVLWKLRLGGAWSVPVVELVRGKPTRTVILLNDAGRAASPGGAERLLRSGCRVLAVDLFYFGEAKLFTRDYLCALLVSAAGQRPLGVQAAQLVGVAQWSLARHGGPVEVVATGPRTSLIAVAAAGVEEKAIGGLELQGCRATLREVIEENRTVDQMPEVFCFGLLEAFDIKQLLALVAPRPVRLGEKGKRHDLELEGLARWYELFGARFDPLG